MRKFGQYSRVKCDDCGLERAHTHCPCGHALPMAIVHLGQTEPDLGTSLRIIPSNYIVMCPACGDGVIVRVKGRTVQ